MEVITQEFDSLSRQLKLIARYVEQHRDHIGLDRIQDVAERCGVQPSAVIRFAKHLGVTRKPEMLGETDDGRWLDATALCHILNPVQADMVAVLLDIARNELELAA